MTREPPKVALVTGASRGAGRGIALGLGDHGMTVYVTGRSTRASDSPLGGTVQETADLVTRGGGRGIPVICDHADPRAIERLLQQIEREQGRLDILHNNVTFIHDELTAPSPFWQRSVDLVKILDVGLKSAYYACYYAAPMLLRQKRGLIAFSSSFGAACYMHGPAYGAQKAGVDKFAADMGVDFENDGVCCVSLWMGPLQTERFARALAERPEQYQQFADVVETPQFTADVLWAIANDPDNMKLSGQTLVVAEIAQRYGIRDRNGRQPPSYRASLGEPRLPHPARVY
ncbi:MAG: SDR family NAD(P)-dependent oxidoreductase [Proteobacteria bacterium]|nr:SDR family NAD(P)-dependent oxidoreductase [Pseudomonadota bacterium]